MKVSEFQQKLSELCALAKKNGNRLTQAQIREGFAGMELETEQMHKLLRYLQAQGIEMEGMADAAKESGSQERKLSGTGTPLTLEEEKYLKNYLAELQEQPEDSRTTEELFAAKAGMDETAGAGLVRRYLPVAAGMAAEMNCEEIHLEDLIQEANVCLLMALEDPSLALKNDIWLRTRIRKGIAEIISEQTERKFSDDALVAKVEKLEAAVRELTEDDGETKFTVGELAVILDMDVEEIRGVLRLTGDDKDAPEQD